jgi:hypothetical protein
MAGAGFKDFVAGEVLTANDVDTYLMQQSLMVFADASARDTAITAPSEGMFAFLTGTDLLTYYDGSAWQEFTSGGGGVTISPTAPVDPDQGNLWWDSDDGKMYVYYDDGSSQQWVDAAGPSVAVQSTAPTGYEGQLWLDDTDGSMYVYYTDPGGGASSWIGAVSRSGGILQVVSTTKTDTFSESVGARPTISGAITGLTATITPRSTSSKILVVVSAAIASNSSNDGVYLHLYRDGAVTGFQGDAAGSRQRAARLHVFNYITQVVAPITYLDSPNTTSSVTYDLRLSHDQSSTATVYCNRGEQDVDDNLNSRAASSITLIEVAG